MAILITGGMGHVGLELVRQAASLGMDVISQYRTTWREGEARAVGGRVDWVRLELSDPEAVARLCASRPIEGCIHSAAVPSNLMARNDPQAAFRANVQAVQNLLEAARAGGWRRFVNVGSGSVFQRWADAGRPIPEDAAPSPTSIYGVTKRAAELLASAYRTEFGLDLATVRISWVYGPPMVPRTRDLPCGPIPDFLREALLGRPVTEASGGDFAASFTHVGDVAAGLLAAYRAPKLNHDIYHLGSGENYDTFRVAEAVCKAVPGAIVDVGSGTKPWTESGIIRGPLAGHRLRDDANFAGGRTLDQGIADFAQWMCAHPQAWQ